jgi:DNA-binding beta-propeller fold protein YncE
VTCEDSQRMRFSCLLVSFFVLCLPHAAWAKWYLLASVHPNNLIVIDTETDTVVKNIALEGRGPSLNIAPNPAHPQYAYVVNDLARSVAMVDLDEGKQVASFPLSNENELVRTMAIDVNPQGTRLFIYEMPLKKGVGHYEAEEPRIRVMDLETNKMLTAFTAPRQVMSLASSQDGKRLYAFSVGQDISVFDAEKGKLVDTLPLLNRNVTGIGRTDGLPAWNPYQENNYLVSFSVTISDSLTGQTTLGVASLDLSQADPELQISELQPYNAESYNITAQLSPKTNKAYFSYNSLWKIDPKTRQVEKTAPLSNTYFFPLLHPDGKKIYCGANWSDIAVFDAETLEPITKIALGHSQTGGGNDLRFVQKETVPVSSSGSGGQ